MLETIAKILRTDAEGLFGIAVKLSALPKEPGPEDYLDAVKSVQQDIDRLIGTNFSNYTRDPEEIWGSDTTEA